MTDIFHMTLEEVGRLVQDLDACLQSGSENNQCSAKGTSLKKKKEIYIKC